MLRVALDTTPLIGGRTGVGQFTAGLMEGLADRVEVVPFAMTWRGRPRGAKPLPARPMREIWKRCDWPPISWWTGPVDVVHGTNFVVPPASSARLVTVHDLTSVRFPEFCTPDVLAFPEMVLRAIKRGAHVHCVSRFVANEVIGWSGCPADQVHVVYHGIPTQLAEPLRVDVEESAVPKGPYALVLGTIEPRKDHAMVLRAFAEVARVDSDLHVVVAGADGWGVEQYRRAYEALPDPVKRRVIRLPEVSDPLRNALVAHARVLVYPSVYEGFGFPPLEAMAAGIPVVATDAGAVPEVLGSDALIVPVGDHAAMAAELLRVHSDEGLRAKLQAVGYAEAAKYSWARCGQEMAAVYQQITQRVPL